METPSADRLDGETTKGRVGDLIKGIQLPVFIGRTMLLKIISLICHAELAEASLPFTPLPGSPNESSFAFAQDDTSLVTLF